MTEPRIVESGPINIKLTTEAAIQMLLSDPAVLQEVLKAYLISKLQEQASVVDPKQEGDRDSG